MTSGKHQLQNTWVLWFDSKKTQKGDDWEASLLQVQAVGTVEEFWTAYNHIKRPSSLEVGANYHFFKKGIKPMWEDPGNKNGGKWSTLVMKDDISKLDECWELTLLRMIGETLDEGLDGDQVCGFVLGKRKNMAKLSLWIRDKTQETTVKELGRRLKETLKLSVPLEFAPHDAPTRADAQYKI